MILLAVDDEKYVLNSVKNNMDWESLGITEVLLATNASQAKRMLHEHVIDIILCDIEMPQESGLSLLLWVNESYPDVPGIVLTCHDNFEYVQDALRLNIVDYLMKPVSMQELYDAIKKASALREKKKELNNLSEYGRYWSENKIKLREIFWQDILIGSIISDDNEIEREAKKRNLTFDINQLYIPIYIRVTRHIGGSGREVAADKTAVKKIAQSMVTKEGEPGTVLDLGSNILYLLCPLHEGVTFASIYESCEEMVATSDTYLAHRLICYIGQRSLPREITAAGVRLMAFMELDVTQKKRVVVMPDNLLEKRQAMMSPNLNILAVLLLNKAFGRAKEEIIELLQVDYADREYVEKFYQSFVNVIFTVLEKHGYAYETLIGKTETGQRIPSFDSIQIIQDWALRIVDSLADDLGETTIVSKVKNYINGHLDERLTRERLAKLVFLHADYLNQIFKKECGISIHDYVTEQRMELARKLLSDTAIHTSSVALQVGYSNFSQFAKQFKKTVGSSPMEFRKICAKDTAKL